MNSAPGDFHPARKCKVSGFAEKSVHSQRFLFPGDFRFTWNFQVASGVSNPAPIQVNASCCKKHAGFGIIGSPKSLI